ncbi:MAG TPA: lipopolysaccharide heptosyltransferase II [Candidatus Dormibacteraeota bacterium]|nr:lipopolysaccharide heptosyltransferase II [Candidatus Dormibacteraeota bacterium]
MKIVVRTTNWVGDAIMAMPALRAVREKFPDAEIGVIGRPYVLDIYREQGIADEFIAYDSAREHRGFSGREKLAAQLHERKYDIALLLQNAFDAAWLAWRAKIPERIGYARDGRSLLLTKAIPVPKAGQIPAHEKFYYLELIRRAGWIDRLPEVPWIELRISGEKQKRAEEFLIAAGSQKGQTRIAVGAGASYGSAKCWPPDRFAEALNKLTGERDAGVILFGTTGEATVSAAIVEGLKKKPIDLTGKTAIVDLPALLSRCNLFIGNDSGAMHVAAAVGLPIVAVFGPTDPYGTVPVTPKCTVVQQKPYCSPCFLRRCPTDHRCMTAVAPAMVQAAAQVQLAEVTSA